MAVLVTPALARPYHSQTERPLILGTCHDPAIVFDGGSEGHEDMAYKPSDMTQFKHKPDQDFTIISQFICDRLRESCNASGDAVIACADGQAAAKNLQGQAAADAFNSALGTEPLSPPKMEMRRARTRARRRFASTTSHKAKRDSGIEGREASPIPQTQSETFVPANTTQAGSQGNQGTEVVETQGPTVVEVVPAPARKTKGEGGFGGFIKSIFGGGGGGGGSGSGNGKGGNTNGDIQLVNTDPNQIPPHKS
ncbi:MAG: hypothetical protein M1838_001575 [Thelocarpon superellum]|nr:MAG: hypothetical protein M1838_001575 [Thelocarpon superellum]